jgi:CRP-like cAMP-binding protein
MAEDPSNSELLTALQGMWRQQSDLITGVERRLGAKIEQVEERLDKKLTEKLAASEARLGERLAQEIQDRPVVVHVDMSRVSELEKQVQELARRVAELEARH